MRTEPYLLTPNRKLPTAEEIAKLESTFSVKVPEYAEFMENFGEGIISSAVRVYPPHRILAETEEIRKRWKEYFLWDEPDSELAQQDLADAVPICDSMDGDEVAFVPCKDALYILPRHSYAAKRIGDDLSSAIEYICSSGKIYSDVDFLYFESWEGREKYNLYLDERGFDFEKVLTRLKQVDHIHLSTSEEEEFISILCPWLQGSVSIFGEDAVITTDSDVDPDPMMLVLEELGYES